MAGIYIHIPFCRQACHYCNFHFATSLHYKDNFVAALINEIELQKDYLQGEPVETIYFGGGTPSLLNIEDLILIIDKLRATFTLDNNPEITLEANPDDITEEKLTGWKEAGINRLSIGVQSFFEEDLKWMNRAHTAKQAMGNLQLAKKHFDNITVDLIYGSPGLNTDKWRYNVQTAISLGIPHLSCYALTVEAKTPLDKMIREQKSADVNPEKQSIQFLQLMQWMEEAGYEHYEISNFAKPASTAGKPGWRSRHNSSYWQGKKYLGLGPSAHSFNSNERQWNVANNNIYIQSLQEGKLSFEKEVLTDTQKLNEYIMVSLRTMEGISFEILSSKHNIIVDTFLARASKHVKQTTMVLEDNFLKLTKEGKLLADGIAADLFF
jgi:oxygen-independent coproporphyrinogen III oxidase